MSDWWNRQNTSGLSVGETALTGANKLLTYSSAGELTDTPATAYPDALTVPVISTVTNVGTPGVTSYGYKVRAFNLMGESVQSAEVTTATGAATLNSTNKNRITWAAVTGAVEYKLYRTTAAGTPATTGYVGHTTALTLDDTGLTVSPDQTVADIGSSDGVLVAGSVSVTGQFTSTRTTGIALAIRNGTTGVLDGSVAPDGAGGMKLSAGVALSLNAPAVILPTVAAPSAANSTGTAGSIAWSSGFLYVCVADNTWKRVAIATW